MTALIAPVMIPIQSTDVIASTRSVPIESQSTSSKNVDILFSTPFTPSPKVLPPSLKSIAPKKLLTVLLALSPAFFQSNVLAKPKPVSMTF